MLKKKLGLLTPEEEQRLKELEAKMRMDKDCSKIHESKDDMQMLDENENPFEEQN